MLNQSYSKELNAIVSQMFAIDFRKRINAAKIIQLPYFNNLKDHIIYDRVYLVDPYLLCLYEFENGEIEKSLNYIVFCIKDMIQINNEEYLKKFIILKFKILLYTERFDEFKNFDNTFESQLGKLKNIIWTDPNFYISYQSIIIEFKCIYNFTSLPSYKILQLLRDKTSAEIFLNFDSLILFYQCYGIYLFKSNCKNILPDFYIKEALNIYMKVEISDNVEGTIQFSRMNFILGSIYKQQGLAQKNLSYIEQALISLFYSVSLHPFYKPFQPSFDILKAMINYLNLLKGVELLDPRYYNIDIVLIQRSIKIFTKKVKEKTPIT